MVEFFSGSVVVVWKGGCCCFSGGGCGTVEKVRCCWGV